MKSRHVLLAAAFAVLLAGCESLPPYPLAGTTWEVVSLGGRPVIENSGPLTAEFRNTAALHCFGGLNGFKIDYEVQGNRIVLGEFYTVTNVGSFDPERRKQESAYFSAILRTRTFSVGDGDLLHCWFGANGDELAVLKRVDR